MAQNLKKLLPAFAATLMGIGLARFSFTPIAAVMVEQQHLTSNEITVVAAFMLSAYIFGAFSAHRLAQKVGFVNIMHICFVLVPVGFVLEGLTASFWPVAIVRFVMNFAGAVLMVLGPPAILSLMPFKNRGFAGGVIFTGVGFGVLVAGGVVALSAAFALIVASMILFFVAVIVATLGWFGWPGQEPGAVAEPGAVTEPGAADKSNDNQIFTLGFVALLFAYAADAVSFVPHTVYLSDFVASELSYGAELGGYFWVIFGAGAVIGAISVAGLVAVFGNHTSIEIVLAIKALAIISVGFSTNLALIAVSAFVVGALSPGIAMLVAMRVGSLVSAQDYTKAWGIVTGCFALGQFGGAAGMSGAYHMIEKYQPLYLFGGLIEFFGLMVLIIGFRILNPVTKGLTG